MPDANAPMIQEQLSYLLSQLWVLNHETGRVEHPESFNAWLEQAQTGRDIAKTKMNEVEISTVFLPLDPKEHPALFETMILGGQYDGYCREYTTLQQARQGHWDIVDSLRQGRFNAARIEPED